MRLARLALPALLLSTCALLASGCGAGQIASTATQRITQEGSNGERAGVSLRGALIAAPLRGGYKQGESAPVYLAIVTDEGVSDTLVAVKTDAATSVNFVRSAFSTPGGPAQPAAPAESETPSASASPSSGPLDLGKGSLIRLAEGMDYLELRGLTRDLIPSDTISVTFTFAKAGDITLKIPVATPDTAGPRLKPSKDAAEG